MDKQTTAKALEEKDTPTPKPEEDKQSQTKEQKRRSDFKSQKTRDKTDTNSAYDIERQEEKRIYYCYVKGCGKRAEFVCNQEEFCFNLGCGGYICPDHKSIDQVSASTKAEEVQYCLECGEGKKTSILGETDSKKGCVAGKYCRGWKITSRIQLFYTILAIIGLILLSIMVTSYYWDDAKKICC